MSGCTGSVIVPDHDHDNVDSVAIQQPDVVVVHPLEEQTGIAGLAVNSSQEGEVSVLSRAGFRPPIGKQDSRASQ